MRFLLKLFDLQDDMRYLSDEKFIDKFNVINTGQKILRKCKMKLCLF